ncbi:hypothetical protein ERICII_03966 [Paenibacillus larvae subsp. larvae DSM 25430]|uniref:Uncharacterized protein n=1 Tax=Paenibacillus larvae subsp. larvae DSM 25430 TaxID=697284 RepID=V9W9C0_9BACL|nr:hypothetical protein ERIC2_c39760 [Paenibacillus larvae subsp. larvae DSM 25430]AVG14201.1 hypothetical protein ERICII_03966 [Paenibacillus larvae subsp. larvae DSM 25430]
MYDNGQPLLQDCHFQDHIEAEVPVQVYYQNSHKDIGFVRYYTTNFIKINNTYYSRHRFTFISRPGY